MEKENATTKKTSKNGIIFAVAVCIISLIGGGFAIHHFLTRQQFVTTGNANVKTDIIHISSVVPGVLERFNLYEGMEVHEGDVLGWVQHAESFRSPANGVVISTSVTEGQYIMPMEPLATIAVTSNLHIQANIDETDILNIKLGQPAFVTVDGLGNRSLEGYVRRISRANEAQLYGGIPIHISMGGTFRRITHTVPVEIVITDDVDLSYFIGASARVRLPVLE